MGNSRKSDVALTDVAQEATVPTRNATRLEVALRNAADAAADRRRAATQKFHEGFDELDESLDYADTTDDFNRQVTQKLRSAKYELKMAAVGAYGNFLVEINISAQESIDDATDALMAGTVISTNSKGRRIRTGVLNRVDPTLQNQVDNAANLIDATTDETAILAQSDLSSVVINGLKALEGAAASARSRGNEDITDKSRRAILKECDASLKRIRTENLASLNQKKAAHLESGENAFDDIYAKIIGHTAFQQIEAPRPASQQRIGESGRNRRTGTNNSTRSLPPPGQTDLRVKSILPAPDPADSAPAPGPANSAPTPDPANSAPVPDPANSAPVPDPANSAPTPDPANSAPVPDPANSAPAPGPANSAPTPDPANSAPAPGPANSAPTSDPANSAPVPDPANSAPVPDPANSAPVPDPADSAPTPDPADPAPAPDPTDSAPVPGPTATLLADQTLKNYLESLANRSVLVENATEGQKRLTKLTRPGDLDVFAVVYVSPDENPRIVWRTAKGGKATFEGLPQEIAVEGVIRAIDGEITDPKSSWSFPSPTKIGSSLREFASSVTSRLPRSLRRDPPGRPSADAAPAASENVLTRKPVLE